MNPKIKKIIAREGIVLISIVLSIFINGLIPTLIFAQEDHGHKLSPDGSQIIFIRDIKPCPITPNTGWVPGDYDEIWSMRADGSDQRCIIKNNCSSNQDMSHFLGSFDSLHFSPDGKRIYFLSQNCATDAILYRANSDGSNIKRISNAHQLDVIGGNPKDEYYGHLVAGVRKSQGAEPIRWTVVLLNAEGIEIMEIEDVEAFWKEHKKL